MTFNEIYFRLDGEVIEKEVIDRFFLRDQSRNIRYSYTKKTDVLNFVGFIISDSYMLVSLPKHYTSVETLNTLNNKDIELLFNILLREQANSSRSYFGELEAFESSFPFKYFFDVYSYYQKYGLFSQKLIKTKPGFGGKISWKDTLRKSNVIIKDQNILFSPFYIKKTYSEYVFLSECMTYIINHTINKFPFFLRKKPVGSKGFNNPIFENSDFVIAKLNSILSSLFKDIDINLVKSMISFFKNLNEGGNIVLKHYNFELVWEKIVKKYLNNYFIDVNWDEETKEMNLLFADIKLSTEDRFIKNKIYINKVNKYHRIEPDHYYLSEKRQYIFDSKYYSKLLSIDYKQIAYFTFLKNRFNKKTINILFLPTELNNSLNLYFELKENFYENIDDKITIYSYYLNTKNAMLNYMNLT